MDLIAPLAHASSMDRNRLPGKFWWFQNKNSLSNGSLNEDQNLLDFVEIILFQYQLNIYSKNNILSPN